MENHQSGLHKEVSAIFEGVWDPETDNVPPAIAVPVPSSAKYLFPGAPSARETGFGSILKGLMKVPGLIFSSRARREKKRLGSISKHLMINMPS